MPKVRIPSRQRFLMDGVSWQRYTRLMRELSDRHFRLTYDRGILEIMTLSHAHENLAAFLSLMIFTLTQELRLPFHLGRSTTLRRRRKQRGLEPDDCYWIAHAGNMRGKTVFNFRTDPPPDLAIEVDITHSSLDRMAIYAKLHVPEVWRYDATGLAFFTLGADRKYADAPISTVFSLPIAPADLMPFIQMRAQMEDSEALLRFRAWVQTRIASAQP